MKRPHSWFLLTSLTFALVALTPAGVAGPPQDSKATSGNKHSDLAGVWFMEGKVEPNLIAPENAPLTPWGAEQFKLNHQSLNPDAICLPTGVPKIWQLPAPFEIIPLPGRILIFHEHEHMVRQIHMNRTEHPKDLVPTWMGTHLAVGRRTATARPIQHPHRGGLWGNPTKRRTSLNEPPFRQNVLQVNITIEDPKGHDPEAVRRFDLRPAGN